MFDPPELKALIKVSQDWGHMAANHTMGHLTSEDYRDWIDYNKTTLVQAFKTASVRVGEAKARAKAVKTVRLWVGESCIKRAFTTTRR